MNHLKTSCAWSSMARLHSTESFCPRYALCKPTSGASQETPCVVSRGHCHWTPCTCAHSCLSSKCSTVLQPYHPLNHVFSIGLVEGVRVFRESLTLSCACFQPCQGKTDPIPFLSTLFLSALVCYPVRAPRGVFISVTRIMALVRWTCAPV